MQRSQKAEVNKAELNKKEKENAIFDAACHVIKEKGFHQARISDIAKRAGISYGLVYHYFGSKDNLYDAILNEWWTGLFSAIDDSDRDLDNARDKLGALVGHFFGLFENRPDLIHIFITEISRASGKLTPDRRQYFKEFFERTERIMKEGQESGHLRNDVRARYLTYFFLGAMESFISTMVLEDQRFKSAQQRRRIEDGLLEVFFNGAGV
jgi:TetR/AcrR family fatty acid metabolism transcriptional regulator